MRRVSRAGAAAVALATLGTLVFAGSSAGHGTPWHAANGSIKKFHHGDAGAERTKKAILFSSDGMRPDLMERYAAKGIMPTFKHLLKKGVAGDNGLLQGFPPNTGVGWHTLATGTWPGEHGSTNNTFHRTGDALQQHDELRDDRDPPGRHDRSSRPSGPARRSSPSSGSPPARSFQPCRARSIDFRTFIGGRGIVLNYDLPGQPALANSFGVAVPAPGRSPRRPAGRTFQRRSARRSRRRFTHSELRRSPATASGISTSTTRPNDGTTNYDRVLIVNSADAQGRQQGRRQPGRGEWADAKLTLAGGALAGKTAGFYAKLIDLNADASQFRIYFTSVQRVNATLQRARSGRLRTPSPRRWPATSRPRPRPTSRRSRR